MKRRTRLFDASGLLLLTAAIIAGLASWHTYNQQRVMHDDALRRWHGAQAAKPELPSSAEESRQLIAQWLPETPEASWREQLLSTQQQLRIPGLQAEIRPVAASTLASWHWEVIEISLHMKLLHEADLLRLLEQLGLESRRYWLVDSCTLEASSEGAELSPLPLIATHCQLRYVLLSRGQQ